MKFAALLVCLAGLMLAQTPAPEERPGNFDIRFEPTAKLQTGVEVPFQITVNDALRKPLVDAKVTLQIEMLDHTQAKRYRATATDPGVYIAKPVFPVAGEWSVYVEVRRGDQFTARTIQFSVAD